MPNWCANTLRLRHEDPAMMSLVQQAVDRNELFQTFVPMPASLNITAGQLGDVVEQEKLEMLQDANRDSHGYKDWYDFCVSEWGTKWDANNITINSDSDQLMELIFDTAWSPPLAFYDRMVEQGFEVSAYYYEPGCSFVGHWDNGADDCYEIPGDADGVRESIPEYLDDYFGISESMEEWADEGNN